MSDAEQLLSTLKDIQLPQAPVGVSSWIIASNLFAFMVLCLAGFWRYHRRKNQWRFEAITRIQQAASMPPEKAIFSLAKVLKQIIIHRHGHCPDIRGTSWLRYLDEEFSTDWFTQSSGRQFGHSLYQPLDPLLFDATSLCLELKQLVLALPSTPKKNHHDRTYR